MSVRLTTRRVLSGALLVSAALALTACGPEDDTAGDSGGGASASAPSKGKTADEGPADEAGGDCGQPPKLPAGHKMIEIAERPTKGSMTAKDAEPECTPNDFVYHGKGEPKYYLFSTEVTAELALGSGSVKSVPVGELWTHAGDCLTDQSAVNPPYSCSGNIYDITLDGEGNVKTIKEVWHA
ncbi:hypothetical protein [Streptomyces sp. NPDC018031]|uniref:hypothetical protein n=1 Tax=Streptomyces sp. NPDC018031 TaxID=3365033 RepID=UPI0037BCDB31